ncbi:hypothetical protein SDJN02_19052, partial [Cucurbita argyrosperma subsp. argyrosperma]|uniref:Uncharacterized protein LOC111441772 n=2 Tax=Cucurbita TaxID=3660 RepID=A0A6J1F3D3_CUCMO
MGELNRAKLGMVRIKTHLDPKVAGPITNSRPALGDQVARIPATPNGTSGKPILWTASSSNDWANITVVDGTTSNSLAYSFAIVADSDRSDEQDRTATTVWDIVIGRHSPISGVNREGYSGSDLHGVTAKVVDMSHICQMIPNSVKINKIWGTGT